MKDYRNSTGPSPELRYIEEQHAKREVSEAQQIIIENRAVELYDKHGKKYLAARAAILEAVLQTLVDEGECYCLDAQERAGRGVCGHCQGKAVLAR